MVYSIPDNLFGIQGDGTAGSVSNEPIRVFYNGTGLHTIAGPVPFVNLSKNYNRTEAGIIQSIVNKVTIDGKIVKTSGITATNPGVGTTGILNSIKQLDDLFKCDAGIFEIKCGSDISLSASGVRVNSFTANKSNDNWLFSADYTVELEYYSTISGYSGVKKASDNWSLEPIEEYVYTNMNMTVATKNEYVNPQILPGVSTSSSSVTPGGGSTGSQNIDIVTIPQFKLSRKLSAEGLPTGSSGCPTSGNYTAYINAKQWVASKLAEPFGGTYGSGGPTFDSSSITALNSFKNIFLYNHLRVINFSEIEGTYEVNDTWLAMPTGLRYLEDYTIESNTDEKFIKTVSIQGTIKGLSFAPIPIMSGASGLVPSGTGGAIDLTFSLSSGVGPFQTASKILDNMSQSAKDSTNFYSNKYQNAMSGWINDIKPYLYRRAHISLNSPERTTNYVNPSITPAPPPNNPVYCKENLLNIIPISTSETHDPRKGIISYNYQFNNKFRFISGVLYENISINDTGPIDVINEAFVLGRRLGPVLQSLGTRTAAKKDLTFEVVVVPPSSWDGFFMTSTGCPLWTGGTVYATITGIIEGFKPFGDRSREIFGNITRTNDNGQVFLSKDDQNWNPNEGRYTRTISWTYQTCNISRNWMDN